MALAIALARSDGRGARLLAAGERGRAVRGAHPDAPGQAQKPDAGAPQSSEAPRVKGPGWCGRSFDAAQWYESRVRYAKGHFEENVGFRRNCLLICAGSARSCTLLHKARSRPAQRARQNSPAARVVSVPDTPRPMRDLHCPALSCRRLAQPPCAIYGSFRAALRGIWAMTSSSTRPFASLAARPMPG